MTGPLFAARRLFLRRQGGGGRGRPLWGAAAGIALALIPLVTVDHVADGMIRGIIDRYRETATYHLQIHSWGSHGPETWNERIDDLAGYDGVTGAWLERQGFALARSEGSREGLTLRAVPPGRYGQDPAFASLLTFDSGTWDLSDPSTILLGREAARRLDALPGDTLRVLTGRTLPDGRYLPKVTRFVVKGVFSTGYQDIDRLWAFIPLATGWEILSPESSRTFVGVKIENPDKGARPFRNRLTAELPARWVVYDWVDLNRSRIRNFDSTRTSLLFIMALLIVVASMNVSSSLVMLALERRREIGILKCAGTSPRAVAATFLLAGLLAAFTGVILGLGAGLVVSRWVNEIIAALESLLGFLSGIFDPSVPAPRLLDEAYYLQEIPIRLRWGSAGIIGGVSMVLALAAGWIPARRAARLRPLEVLRRH